MASTKGEAGQPGRMADELVWLVVICKPAVPVAPAATETLEGLKAQAV